MSSQILEVFKVTPPRDSPIEMYLPLTFFDLQSVGSPVDHLFFYQDPLFSASTLIPNLKQSLSLSLKHFLPFAGNITWPSSSPKPLFRYEKGDGVVFTVAECNADFYHLSCKKLREWKILRSLVAHIVGSDTESPLLAVKVTIFPNTGFCIGITNHSAASDGKAISMFIKTWASFSKFGASKGITPVFDRESVRERYMEVENSCIEILRRSKLAFWKSMLTPMDSLRGTFRMSGLQIKELKELVADARLQNCKNNGDIYQVSYVSTFTITYAYVVLCMVKAKRIENNQVRVLLNYDCRERLSPPLSLNYIGNCVGVCFMHFDKEELLGRDGLMIIANSVSMSIKGLDKNKDLREAREWLPNLMKVPNIKSMEVFVSGSSKFGLHSIDFGWGKPLKADILENGGITFTEVEDGGGPNGIDVDFFLCRDEMEKFASIFAQGLTEIKTHKLAAL